MALELTRNELLDSLKTSVMEVTFTKVNGDKRIMTCTLIPSMLPAVVTNESAEKQERKVNENVISVWDLNAAGWRSFRLDKIESVVLSQEAK